MGDKAGLKQGTPDKAGTSFDKTSVTPAVEYKTIPGGDGSGRKDILQGVNKTNFNQ